MDIGDLLSVLHINRIDWRLSYGTESNNFLVDIDTFSYQYIHVIIRDNAYRMDTTVGNISYEVSIIIIEHQF